MGNIKIALVFTIALIAIICIHACQNENLLNCEEHIVSDCNENVQKTNIRIKNCSGYDFCNVVLNPSGGNKNLGVIRKGETTCYRSFDVAYGYAYVKLFIGNEEFILQPIDYVGENPLGIGKYTYSIDVADYNSRSLSIETLID